MLGKSSLTEFDFHILLDRSGSMGEPVSSTSVTTRWDATRESIIAFAEDLAELDDDGVNLLTFGRGPITVLTGADAQGVRSALDGMKPGGSTPMAAALSEVVKLAGSSPKRDFVVIFTDGVPDSEEEVERVLRETANRQANDEDLTFLFVQVGDDPQATRYLKKLDSGIQGVRWDIVDVKTIAEANNFASITDLILHSIGD